ILLDGKPNQNNADHIHYNMLPGQRQKAFNKKFHVFLLSFAQSFLLRSSLCKTLFYIKWAFTTAPAAVVKVSFFCRLHLINGCTQAGNISVSQISLILSFSR